MNQDFHKYNHSQWILTLNLDHNIKSFIHENVILQKLGIHAMLVPFLPRTPSKTSNVRPCSALTEIKGIAGRHPTERTETKNTKFAK